MQSPVLFLVFNRPDTTLQVFNAIRAAKPPRLYIAADGPRTHKSGEKELCDEVRSVTKQIDWSCEVKTLFRENNLGCKQAVSRAISWFFEQEEQGIILEDDCLPNDSFFGFCDEMLEKYKDKEQIMHITGSQLYPDLAANQEASYYFSKWVPIWGWATWRRAWHNYSTDVSDMNEVMEGEIFKNSFKQEWEGMMFMETVKTYQRDNINTWDIPWSYTVMKNNGLTIQPFKNFVLNIGFRADATHTLEAPEFVKRIKLETLETIIHPDSIYPDKDIDLRAFRSLYPFQIRMMFILKRFYSNLFKRNSG